MKIAVTAASGGLATATMKHLINEIGTNQGKAFARMSSQSVAHLLMVIFIVLGNISYFFTRKKGSRI